MVAVVTGLLAAMLVPAVIDAAGGSARDASIVSALNAERELNGIPAGVRQNLAWSAKCAQHDAYMAATGTIGHEESTSSAAYTPGGAWAGEHSVLAMGASWQDGDPFDNAPIHLLQLMSPELRQAGVDESGGYVCMTTWPGYNASGWKKPTVYSYPGDGATGVPYKQTANELPFIPASFAGVRDSAATGFNIMVYAEGLNDGWHAHITSATVTGPDGPVTVATLDRTSPTIGPYLPPGSGFVIPTVPLAPGTSYTATVSFNHGAAIRTWQFTTCGTPPRALSAKPAREAGGRGPATGHVDSRSAIEITACS
jgi:hypothetical protein